MPRPKGSKNKKREEIIKPEPPIAKEIKEGTPPKLVGHKVWIPEPNMGTVQPPADKDHLCKGCSHKKEMHYGSKDNWCNVSGCNCQKWS